MKSIRIDKYSLDGYILMGNAVVQQAADDWRSLIKGKNIVGETFGTIRAFFKSKLGQACCGDADAEYILRKLEEEREAVRGR